MGITDLHHSSGTKVMITLMALEEVPHNHNQPDVLGGLVNLGTMTEEEEEEDESGRRKFRSRFMRKEEEEEKTVRFEEDAAPKRQIRVLDTEDVARGPLSGIQRLYDCPRVIIRLQEKEQGPKTPKAEPAKTQSAATTPKPPATPAQKKTSRQTSNEDEIDKIKKENPAKTQSAATTPKPPTPM